MGRKKKRRKNRFRLMKSILEGRVPFLPPSLQITFGNENNSSTDLSPERGHSLNISVNESVVPPNSVWDRLDELGAPTTQDDKDTDPVNNLALQLGTAVLRSPGTPLRDEHETVFNVSPYVQSVTVVTSWPRLEVAIPPGTPQPPTADLETGITPLDPPGSVASEIGEWEEDILLLDAPSFELLCQEHGMQDLLTLAPDEIGPVQFAEPFPFTPGRDLERRIQCSTPLRGSGRGRSWAEYLEQPSSPAEPILPVTPGRDM